MTHYDYGFRIYNPSIARFLSVDPLSPDYPWYTPYQFAGNKPIWAIDLDGLEEYVYQYLLKDGNTTLIGKITNSEVVILGGGFGAAAIETIDKRTGELFDKSELGTIQYQYFDETGNRLNVRRDLKGNFVKGENEILDLNFENWFENSIYIGPNNPSSVGGGVDYRREPQDVADASARRHDKDYDLVGGSGLRGALIDEATIPADIALVQRMNRVIEMYENNEIDPFTGKEVSGQTFRRAKTVKFGFTYIVKMKAEDFNLSVRLRIDSQLEEKKKIDNTPSSTLSLDF